MLVKAAANQWETIPSSFGKRSIGSLAKMRGAHYHPIPYKFPLEVDPISSDHRHPLKALTKMRLKQK